jgi:uncharacterized repeat protein (TIGR03843 family)
MAEMTPAEPQADGPMIAGMTKSEIEAAAMAGRQIAGPMDNATALHLLRTGVLTVVGRLLTASNATFFCVVERSDAGDDGPPAASCVYKPIRGERPLYDFPDGTLACREVGAYLLSETSGWDLIPPTVMRDGPFGDGMVQLWVEVDESVDLGELISTDNDSLRRMAVLDAVLNNADRKGGHLLPLPGGHVQGCDNGLCFAVEPKLRTILWRWRGKRLRADERAVLERIQSEFAGDLGTALAALLSPDEVAATLDRIGTLLAKCTMPRPDRDRPAIPWPPY